MKFFGNVITHINGVAADLDDNQFIIYLNKNKSKF